MKPALLLVGVLSGCAAVEGASGGGRFDGPRVVGVAAFDLGREPLPSAEDAQVAPGVVVLENVGPEHLEAIEAAFRQSHPQAYDRSADLGVVVRAQGQLLRVEPLELGTRRRELLLVLDAPGIAGSMFHAARRNTELYSETEDLLVFDPRLGRVVVTLDSRKVFLIYPLGVPGAEKEARSEGREQGSESGARGASGVGELDSIR